MKLKRLLAVFMALVLVFSLISTCGGFSAAFATGEETVTAPGDVTVPGDIISDANTTGVAAFATTNTDSDATLTVPGDVIVSGANNEAEAVEASSYDNGGAATVNVAGDVVMTGPGDLPGAAASA